MTNEQLTKAKEAWEGYKRYPDMYRSKLALWFPRLLAEVEELRADRERLDWLQGESRGYGLGWICRNSTTGRGMRLHETSREDASPTVRTSIDAARESTNETR
jgi:hypothetical protein